MGATTRTACVLGAAICAALVVAANAVAAFSGANGKIAFSSQRDGNDEIYVMNPDGTDRVDLSRDPASDTTPEWSRDGRRIAFASNRSGTYQVYVMNADGSGVTQLTSAGRNTRPVFTANGRFVIFMSDRDGNDEIYRMRADGSRQTNLTNDPSDDRLPATSPHGTDVVFQSTRTGLARLYTMNIEGRDVREVPGGPTQEIAPNWAPDGSMFAFLGNDGGFDTFDIYLARTDGSHVVQLTNTPQRVEFDPTWSPDGTRLVFEGCTDLGTDNQHCALETIGADGNNETDISTPRIPYLDSFDGDRIDPFWGMPFVSGSGPTIAETAGRLDVTVPAGTAPDPAFGFMSLSLNSACHLLGDFDVQTDYELLQWPPVSRVNLSLNTFDFVGGSFGDVHGMFVFDPGGGTGVSTQFPGPLNTFVPAPELRGTLRLVRVGSTLAAYRLAPAGFTPLQSTSDAAAEVIFGLNVFTNAAPFSHPDVEVAYDNFRVNRGTFSCPAWWTDNAPNWQAVDDAIDNEADMP